MNAIEHVEQELAELRRRLEQSFGVIDALVGIQTEFEDLAKTYQNLKNGSNGADHLAQFRETVNRRLTDLEKVIESTRKENIEELMNAQNELSAADRNLKAEMLQQITKLKLEVEGLFSTLKDEWAQPKEAMQAYVSEFESRLRTELRSALNRMEQSGFSPQHLEKLDKLDTRLHALKGTMISTDKQVKSLRQGLTVAIILSLVAIALPVVLTLAGGDRLSNRNNPAVERTN
jgi:DNA repair exonuclease SbcCD ATPase subunit